MTPLTSIDAEKKTVSLTFDAQQGEKVFYERINIVGNTKTRDKVIRRELRIYEGELTSSSLKDLSQRRVQALGYFETVEVKTRKGTSDNQQIVDVEIKEKATGTFRLSRFFITRKFYRDCANKPAELLSRSTRIFICVFVCIEAVIPIPIC